MNATTNHRAGFVAIVGRPNVGKSTLLNHLLKQKLSITSSKPQTTRHKVTGIATTLDTQYVFMDTPGYQLQHTGPLNRMLNRTVGHAVMDANVIILVVEAGRFEEGDQAILELLPKRIPVFLVINKIDRVPDKKQLLPFIEDFSRRFNFREVIPVSASKDVNLDKVLEVVRTYLPQGEALYDAEQISDQPQKFFAAEIVREKVFRLLHSEIPYSVNVVIDDFRTKDKTLHIQASIWVEKSSQKAILIGKDGAQLKVVGTRARHEMEKFFEVPVYLQLWVKVKKGWAKDVRTLHGLGYHD